MATWLLKTEPDAYAWDDLVRERRTTWDGVKNALAQKHLRAMQKGDRALVYHTGSERRAVGIAEIVRGPFPDAKAGGNLVAVEIALVEPLAKPVPLAVMKEDPKLAGFDLLRIGRLSVVPVSAAHWKELLRLAKG